MRHVLLFVLAMAAVQAAAQVPPNIEAELRKIGQIVDPACTARLYRPLMPASDFNTYWPPDAAAPAITKALYPDVTIVRDQPFEIDEGMRLSYEWYDDRPSTRFRKR